VWGLYKWYVRLCLVLHSTHGSYKGYCFSLVLWKLESSESFRLRCCAAKSLNYFVSYRLSVIGKVFKEQQVRLAMLVFDFLKLVKLKHG
jgi:hypothetical protein